uniref:Uncharacterized protein n=1 Tax=Cacopsylla melanoneura TaxID=428564 RepID=A0A8D8UG56_9HEMI
MKLGQWQCERNLTLETETEKYLYLMGSLWIWTNSQQFSNRLYRGEKSHTSRSPNRSKVIQSRELFLLKTPNGLKFSISFRPPFFQNEVCGHLTLLQFLVK